MIISDDIRELLTGGVSIVLASRNASLLPSIARANGCRIVGGTPARLRLVVSAVQAGPLLDDVRDSAMVSATFTLPPTHRALQFKGSDARVESAAADDAAAVARYVAAFTRTIGPLGFGADFVRAFYAAPSDLVAIEFTPADAFQQTPGPAAGARLA